MNYISLRQYQGCTLRLTFSYNSNTSYFQKFKKFWHEINLSKFVIQPLKDNQSLENGVNFVVIQFVYATVFIEQNRLLMCPSSYFLILNAIIIMLI